MEHPSTHDTRKVALYWHLRELVEGPAEDDTAGTTHHDRTVAQDALNAADPLTALERIRHDAVRSPEQRQHAADLITDYCWPDDTGSQPGVWETDHAPNNTYELEARRRMGTYSPPVSPEDYDGRTGYHHGGLWFPHIGSATPLSCPECGFRGEFWDFDPVDAGDAYEPAHRCTCGWTPPAEPAPV